MLRGLNLTREAGQRLALYQAESAATTLSTGWKAFVRLKLAVSMRTVLVDLLICQGRSCDESAMS
jgi:hypothetical protein